MAAPPQELEQHENAMWTADEKYLVLKGCKNCQTAVKAHFCDKLNPVDYAVFDRERGVNQTRLDSLKANARKTVEQFDPLPQFPTAFKQYANWVTYKDKTDKNPRLSGTFNQATSDNSTTWVDYKTACENIKAGRGYQNLGFVTDGERAGNLTGIDLDGCRNPVDGTITVWAQEILQKAGPTYVEISPSGNGLRAWVIAATPLGDVYQLASSAGFGKPGKVYTENDNPTVQIKIFNDKRYFCVTGEKLPDAPSTCRVLSAQDVVELVELFVALTERYRIPAQELKSRPTKVTRTKAVAQQDGTIKFEPVPPDPAFKVLFAKVGWQPLIDAMNKMEDTRFHDLKLDSKTRNYCPMPGHGNRGVNVKYNLKSFVVFDGSDGAEDGMCHCFGCGYSGDMVKTVREFSAGEEGGGIRYETMYDCARDICKQQGLNPYELFAGEKMSTPFIYEPAVPQSKIEIVDELSAESIPPFRSYWVTGIYKKFVDLMTRGTTLAPQFSFLAAKVVVGAKMAGKVKFENLDVEPRYYGAAIGETGSGKGEAWRRMMQILNAQGLVGGSSGGCGIKIINSADSGAGLKECFFDPPENQPVICYVDEVEGLGNKATATRNPAILDTMIEVADSTTISRVLAKRRKTKDDARLAMFMCGQDGDTYMKAFAGRTKLGMYDRLYPEYGVPVEAGELPPIRVADAYNLLKELNELDYSGVMTMSQDAKDIFNNFWDSQPKEVRTKARWKKNVTLDAYLVAFGRGSKQVETDDTDIALQLFQRQLIIRKVCFRSEVPDKVGFYLGKCKDITNRMKKQLNAGMAESDVALSRRDYETLTNAYRDNEEHLFEKAWMTHSRVHLMEVEIRKANGQKYKKFLPQLFD